jgi:hypothetical protein
MGRMLTTRALQAPVKRPVVPFSSKSPTVGAVTSPPVAPVATQVPKATESADPVRKLSFYFGLAFVFTVFGVLPELTYYVTGINTYLIYWVAPAAILGALFTGGIRRTLQYRAAWYWIAFFVWMVVGIPFSYWRGGSTQNIYDYTRVSMTMLFVVGGLATNWEEVRAVFNTIGMAGLVNLLMMRLFARVENGRLTLDASGTIGNSNDLASHLIVVLPFLLFISMDRKRNVFLRFAMLPAMAYGMWEILGTASRGGLLALGAIFLLMFWRASAKKRLVVLVAGLLLVVVSFAILPGVVLNRLGTLFGQENIEAEESTDARSYLFKTSVRYTLEYPVFGVGLGQFPNFEGGEGKTAGIKSWHATHCAWTQVSAECGIPALILFMMGIGSALVLVHRAGRQARKQGFTDISNACYCYMVAMVGFLVDITFLANAYRFYLPAMIGLAISMSFVVTRQMSAKMTDDRRFAAIIPPQPLAVR